VGLYVDDDKKTKKMDGDTSVHDRDRDTSLCDDVLGDVHCDGGVDVQDVEDSGVRG